ncbi:MAG TPA: hypothetical protein VJU84_03405 [Pyrinomonadaceae bacterium]|nr:hypothetical protein [Pyrinomonadaceae bacterium]
MSKKTIPRKKSRLRTQRERRRSTRLIATGFIVTLTLASAVGPLRDSFGGKRLRALFLASPTPLTIPAANNPSKEYIYAEGKLIATEAPVTLAAPTTVVATTLSSLTTPQVTISWSATAGAHHYQVERTANISTSYTTIDTNVASTTFTDTTVSSVTAYLYRVRAVDTVGNVSPPSNVDVATAISFTDDTLVVHTTPVKADHINQLRQAVDAVRALVNHSAANWGPSVTPGVTTIQATHIQDLRTNLDQARNALTLPGCSYTDNSVEALRASVIKKEHIEQLRQCVR